MSIDGGTQLRIFFQDENAKDILIPIPLLDDNEFYSLETEQPVTLPNGETLLVYAEIALAEDRANISLSIIEGEKCTDVRCWGGLVVGYQTYGDLYVLFQIGRDPCK